METPAPSQAKSPIPSSDLPAPALQAGQPAPAADLTAGGGPSSLEVLTARVTAIQTHLAELDTPQNEAALEIALDALAKPGKRTTEFWLTLLAALGTLGMAVGGLLSGEAAGWIVLVSTGVYGASRFLLKSRRQP